MAAAVMLPLLTAATISSVAGAVGTVGSLLSGVSAIGSILGGNQQAATANAQAKQYELSARTEELKGREQADNIRRSLQATLATQRATFSARGVSNLGGTPVNLAGVSSSNAGRDIQLAQFGAGQSADQARAQAGQSRVDASTAKIAGYTSAASTIGRSLIA